MRTRRADSDLRRWEDEGGAPMARHRSRNKRRSPSQAGIALYYFNVRTDHGLVEDPKGLTLPDLTAALHEALALARRSLAQGDRKGQDRRSWCVEIMDRADQHLLTVAFTEASYLEWRSESRKV
jgi:hypothetical protein